MYQIINSKIFNNLDIENLDKNLKNLDNNTNFEKDNFKNIIYIKNIIEIIYELEKVNKNPCFLFEIIISDKNTSKKNLEKIQEKKEKIILILEKIQNYLKNLDNNTNFEKIFKNQIFGILINIEKIENFTVSFINNLKKDFEILIGQGGLNKINRFFLEQTKIDILKDPQNDLNKQKIDYLHHLNSGMNHVLFKFSKEKKISIFVSLNFFENYNSYKIAKELGRINQNLKFARKYNSKTLISFIAENKYQIKSNFEIENIFSLFDISTSQKKETNKIIENILKIQKSKNSKNYISEGIKLK